ncbi:alpha/beta fold hydrolase [Pelagibacterium halotolerans]|uniref:Putative alpha/beta hydrolase superfamily, alr3514-like protein n=1 Tax=Pelagibacterium halotolerans (strain DSM 22347 / JCM 15775 / CGMCC 1.7692 / B2) TaxID=1082931 RepID=G4RD93_PELHB|nr:alpha/beta hydrolase [Pelagibacterium halotolerans]AEQ50719.1 putative alpha/beta hydrolase superfamily, alr3514-like protein [Pelagibacterium halotolerans B2]QJR19355.1 alpha/beta hydrolase [Pelagibacterium halotolerans]SDZ93923.1 Pimeloyl-ACP methyl ester carboxylesterase [Pelagibacterium halotolerans]
MEWTEDRIEWVADGKPVTIGLTRAGSGPQLLLLPALSSISTRHEMRPLQERLAARYETLSIDWPGFGDLPRPKLDWRPALYRDFLRFVLSEIAHPFATVAAGHAAGYAIAQAAENPASTGRLCLLAPTWRGPLPTMMGKHMGAFGWLARGVDIPVAGAAFYRLNVNGPVIGMMTRGHVYSDPAWVTPGRMAEKRKVTEAPGARYGSFRFVAGELDPFESRESWLAAAGRVPETIALIHGERTPRKSKAEMAALAQLPGVSATVLPQGKLSFYEEYPDETARAVLEALA